MPLVVPLAAGVRLREVLHMEDDDAERFVSLFSVDTIDNLAVVCAAVALRDAGVTSGMKLLSMQAIGPEGTTEDIRLDEDGIRGNWRRPRRLEFEESTLHKSGRGFLWPALTANFVTSLRPPGGKMDPPKERSVTIA